MLSQHRAQILIGRERLQSHASVFTNRPVMIFESVNKPHFCRILAIFANLFLKTLCKICCTIFENYFVDKFRKTLPWNSSFLSPCFWNPAVRGSGYVLARILSSFRNYFLCRESRLIFFFILALQNECLMLEVPINCIFVYTFEDYHWSVRENWHVTLQTLSPNQDLSPMLCYPIMACRVGLVKSALKKDHNIVLNPRLFICVRPFFILDSSLYIFECQVSFLSTQSRWIKAKTTVFETYSVWN